MKNFAAGFLLICGIAGAAAQQQPQAAEQQQQVQPAQASPEQAQQLQQAQQAVQQQQVQQTQSAQPPQPQHIVLRVVGSQVRNPAGERLGLIEEVFASRVNGAIEYAIVSPHYPTNRARQVPVPWGALSHVWDQSRAGGPAGANQIFILNIDAARLAAAPVLDRSRPATIDQTLANSGSFFGQGQQAGATGGTAGTVTGGGAATPVIDQGTATTAPVGSVGIGVPVDNRVIVPGQRPGVQPGGDNRVPPPEQRVPHVNTRAAGDTRSGGTGPATGGSAAPSGGGAAGSSGSSGGSGAAGGGASGK